MSHFLKRFLNVSYACGPFHLGEIRKYVSPPDAINGGCSPFSFIARYKSYHIPVLFCNDISAVVALVAVAAVVAVPAAAVVVAVVAAKAANLQRE